MFCITNFTIFFALGHHILHPMQSSIFINQHIQAIGSTWNPYNWTILSGNQLSHGTTIWGIVCDDLDSNTYSQYFNGIHDMLKHVLNYHKLNNKHRCIYYIQKYYAFKRWNTNIDNWPIFEIVPPLKNDVASIHFSRLVKRFQIIHNVLHFFS